LDKNESSYRFWPTCSRTERRRTRCRPCWRVSAARLGKTRPGRTRKTVRRIHTHTGLYIVELHGVSEKVDHFYFYDNCGKTNFHSTTSIMQLQLVTVDASSCSAFRKSIFPDWLVKMSILYRYFSYFLSNQLQVLLKTIHTHRITYHSAEHIRNPTEINRKITQPFTDLLHRRKK